MLKSAVVASLFGVLLACPIVSLAAETQVERGKYLVSIIPCTDCHTPGTFLGHADMKRYLGGSEVGFEVPGLGVFYGPELELRTTKPASANGPRADRNAPDHRRQAPGRPHSGAADAGR